MMLTLSETTLRQIVREEISGGAAVSVYTDPPEVVKLSPVVDPAKDSTVPLNPNFTPHDKQEFSVAVNNLVKGLPDDDMPKLYGALKKASTEEGVDESMAAQGNKEAAQAERLLRNEIRRMLRNEAFVDPEGRGIDFFGDEPTEVDEEDPDFDPEAAKDKPSPAKDKKPRKMTTMQDVGGATFEQIAAETGLSVAGAKQAVDKALRRAQFLAQDLDFDERELIVLTAIRDYLEKLKSTGELTAADIRLMSDHPDIIRELDGFREFLQRYIRRVERQYRKED